MSYLSEDHVLNIMVKSIKILSPIKKNEGKTRKGR